MYMRDHSAVGTSIAMVTYNAASITNPWVLYLFVAVVSTISHLVVDKINEHDFGDENYIMEPAFMILLVGLVVMLAPMSSWALIAVAIFFANLPDIMDKRFYRSFINPEKYPARRDWPCHKKGYTVIDLTPAQTIAFSFIMYAVMVLILV